MGQTIFDLEAHLCESGGIKKIIYRDYKKAIYLILV